jgi:predicted signal transduction protein with EAL and GGDEF domain
MAATNMDTTRGPAEVTGWTGWIAFASFVMMLSGALSLITGFFAVINNNWTVWNNHGAPFGSTYWWGWWTMLVGVVVIAIGGALMRGSLFARTVAVFVAGGSLISQFVSLNVAPFWSLTIIAIDVLVIWAVMVHGRELRDR